MESSGSTTNEKNKAFLICVTTKNPPPISQLQQQQEGSSNSSSSSSPNDAIQIICPYTGAILTTTAAHYYGLKVGGSIGINSFSRISFLGGADDKASLFLLYGGRTNQDMYAMLLAQKETSASSSASTSSLRWKCRLREYMQGGLHPTPCGRYIIAGGKSGNLYCWSTLSGSNNNGAPLLNLWRGHYRSVECIAFSDCGYYVVSGGADGVVNVWSLVDIVCEEGLKRQRQRWLSSGRSNVDDVGLSLNVVKTWSEHHLPVTAMHTLPSSRIVSTSEDRQVVIMELFSGRTLAKISMDSSISSVTADKEGRRLFLGGADGVVYCVDLDSYAIATTAQSATVVGARRGGNCRMDAERQSLSDSRLLETVLGYQQGGDKLTAVKGEQSTVLEDSSLYISELRGHERAVSCLEVLEDGIDRLLISGSENGSVRVWDIDTRSCTHIVQPWSTTFGGEMNPLSSAMYPCSTITILRRDNMTTGQDFDMMSSSASKTKNQAISLVTLIQPLQRFPKFQIINENGKEKEEEEEECVYCIVQPVRRTTESLEEWNGRKPYHSIDLSLPDNKKIQKKEDVKCYDNISDQKEAIEDLPAPSPSSTTVDEVEDLRKELEEAKKTIARWQKVNNKLIQTLKKKSDGDNSRVTTYS